MTHYQLQIPIILTDPWWGWRSRAPGFSQSFSFPQQLTAIARPLYTKVT